VVELQGYWSLRHDQASHRLASSSLTNSFTLICFHRIPCKARTWPSYNLNNRQAVEASASGSDTFKFSERLKFVLCFRADKRSNLKAAEHGKQQ
jgi:hypothetical protein